MKKHTHLGWFLLLLLLLATRSPAQSPSTVEVVADLLEQFRPAQVKAGSSCEVRRPASAGDVKQDGLFEHPLGPNRPARIEYQFDLPALATNDLLLFAFDIALADGVKLTALEDGVRFIVELDGRQAFSMVSRETRWQSHAVNLATFAGRRVSLALVTDAIANSSYDWSTWGSPRVLRFRAGDAGAFQMAGAGRITAPISIGALAVQCASANPLTIRFKPLGGAPSEWTIPPLPRSNATARWLVKDFSFPAANGLELEWEPREALAAGQIRLAAYPPQPRVVLLSAARALITAGESTPLCVEVKNEGRGKLTEGQAQVELQSGDQSLPRRALPALAPGESWRGEWPWKAPDTERDVYLVAHLAWAKERIGLTNRLDILGPPVAVESLTNRHMKLDFDRHQEGFACARIYARQDAGWTPIAVWTPLFGIAGDLPQGVGTDRIRPKQVRRLALPGGGEALEFTGTARTDHATWQVKLRVELPPDRPLARVHYEWQPDAADSIRALWGPNLYAGDGTTGDAKTWGLFPGLEYLYGPERSSNPRDFAPSLADRRTPHPNKITVPLMAVTIGSDSLNAPEKPGRFFAPDSLKDQPLLKRTAQSAIRNPQSAITVALLWDPHQRWDGEHAFPSARFASPNFDQGMRNHRIGLFLPSTPEFVAENADYAGKPYVVPAGKTLTLNATLVVAPGPATVALREWLRDVGGLPKPNPWPRTFQQELDICRAGFLKTVWDEKSEKWRHCIDWPAHQAPGYAALLWMDSQVAEKPEARQQSRERVELAVKNMLREGGPGMFASQAGCHIMQWEFPFLYGCLPEAMDSLRGQLRQLIQSQQPDGGWLHHAGNAQQADLGQAGDSVLGTCANHAAFILRYARVTGDAEALAAGEKALRFMENFRVPRGGQTWECPMYEPDILAAAYAIRACHDAYRITGNPRWLHDAVYWAETGVPFVYLWTVPDKPMMLGATIPVFGSTFYTHTWLAVPVQWCGLVYSYHVLHLAEDLARTPLPPADSPLPLALNFSPADWRRLVELITVSGMHQQFADGERIGTYPDSISRFEQRNPAFINPEDILLNLLALEGHDPDIKTARVKTARGEVVVSSGARILNPQAAGDGVRFQLAWFQGEPSHSLVAGIKPREVRVNGQPLGASSTPLRREPGWWWDEKRQRVYVTVHHPQPEMRVEILPSGD